MAVQIPDYLLAETPAATVESPAVTPRGGDDLPEFTPEDFQAPPDAPEEVRPDYRSHWLAAIDRIREADDKHQLAHVAMLGGDTRAAKIVAVWPLVAPAFEIPGERFPEGVATEILQQCWMKLWNPAIKTNNPFVLLLAAAAGLTDAEALAAAKMAVQARLIYPDGGISTGASRYVRINASAIMLAAQPRRQAPPKEPPKQPAPARPAAAAPARG